MTRIDKALLAHVTGGGAKDAAYCSQLRAAGLEFGNGAAGGKVADKLLPRWAFDGAHAGVAKVGGGAVGAIEPKLVTQAIDSAMPDFCKRS